MADKDENIGKDKKIVLMFPGQGSQYTGMGKELVMTDSKAGSYFERASEKLSIDLLSIIAGNDKNGADLTQTFFSQISIFTLSAAIKEYVFNDMGKFRKNILCSMGHSLGDYSALEASGYFTFDDGLEIVAERAEMMEEMNSKAEGMMAAVLGLTKEEAELLMAESGESVYLANYNDYKQIVITGLKENIEKFIIFLKNKSSAKVIPLKVKTASHCPLMQPISDKLSDFLSRFSGGRLETDFFSTSEKEFCKEEKIPEVLAGQLVKTINWFESIEYLLALDAEIFIELGPGKVLSNLVRRISQKNNKVVKIFDTDNLESINNLKNFLSERF